MSNALAWDSVFGEAAHVVTAFGAVIMLGVGAAVAAWIVDQIIKATGNRVKGKGSGSGAGGGGSLGRMSATRIGKLSSATGSNTASAVRTGKRLQAEKTAQAQRAEKQAAVAAKSASKKA